MRRSRMLLKIVLFCDVYVAVFLFQTPVNIRIRVSEFKTLGLNRFGHMVQMIKVNKKSS